MREKSLQINTTVNDFKGTIPNSYNLYKTITVPLFLLFIPFLGGNIIVYTPNQGQNREKYFNHIIYKGKYANSGGK